MFEKIKRVPGTERRVVLKKERYHLSHQFYNNKNHIVKAMSSHIIILRALGVEYNSFLITR